jgi:hypothetical protein
MACVASGFKNPREVWVASDDFVFVADSGNDRVQVLTPRLDIHGYVGVGQLDGPSGVCADDAVFVASDPKAAATVSWTPRMDFASCPGTITSQSPTTATTA